MDENLLKILACPKCKGDLILRGIFLVCESCELAYPIVEGVPDLLIIDAWSLKDARKNNYKHNLKL